MGMCCEKMTVVLIHPGCPGQNPESYKIVVCMCVSSNCVDYRSVVLKGVFG